MNTIDQTTGTATFEGVEVQFEDDGRIFCMSDWGATVAMTEAGVARRGSVHVNGWHQDLYWIGAR